MVRCTTTEHDQTFHLISGRVHRLQDLHWDTKTTLQSGARGVALLHFSLSFPAALHAACTAPEDQIQVQPVALAAPDLDFCDPKRLHLKPCAWLIHSSSHTSSREPLLQSPLPESQYHGGACQIQIRAEALNLPSPPWALWAVS